MISNLRIKPIARNRCRRRTILSMPAAPAPVVFERTASDPGIGSRLLSGTQFDDLGCRGLLHAGRAGHAYGISALHLRLARPVCLLGYSCSCRAVRPCHRVSAMEDNGFFRFAAQRISIGCVNAMRQTALLSACSERFEPRQFGATLLAEVVGADDSSVLIVFCDRR